MATPNQPSLGELEEEMREAFLLDPPSSSPDYPEMKTGFDDPAISTPDIEMIFEGKIKKIQGPVLRELSARYPSLFPPSSLHELKDDPLESIWRNPEKTENFFRNLDNVHVASSSQMLARINTFQASLEKVEQTDQLQQSSESLADIENIKHSLSRAKTSLEYVQRETSSTIPLLKAMTNILNGGEVPRAFDPSLDQPEKFKRMISIIDNLSSIFPQMRLNKEGVSQAHDMFDYQPFMNHAMSFLKDMRQNLPALAQESRLPNLIDLEDYQYEKLPTETSIRLLRFDHQGSQPDSNLIKLSFHVVDLQEDPAFRALSYVWGDHRPPLNQDFNKKRAQRCFDIICDEHKVAVTYNLFCALRRLVSIQDSPSAQFGDLDIWIDQLCINQKDLSERNQQVAMMDKIYGQARMVTAWLGEADSHTDKAIRLLEILWDIPVSDDPSFDIKSLILEIPSEQWLALSSLLSRLYFRRAWVVQEVVLANQLVLLCGNKVIPWEHLVHLSNFIQKTRAWTLLTNHAGVFRTTEEHLLPSRWRPPIRFGQQLSSLLDARETITKNKFSPEDLLYLGRRFDATEVKDKFYAMLGLAKVRLRSDSTFARLPPVDYIASIEAVSLNFATYHITSSRRLKILSMVQDRKYRENENLPSWVPDPATPLLPLPLETENGEVATPWDVCGSRGDNEELTVDGNTLIARGFQIDVVDKATIPFNDIVENDQWFELFEFLEPLTNKQFSGMTIDEAFWKTMITSTNSPSRKLVDTSTIDLKACFGDWIISQMYSMRGNRIYEEKIPAPGLSAIYRLDDLKFDMLTFGKGAAGPNNEFITDRDKPSTTNTLLEDPSSRLIFNILNEEKMESDSVGSERIKTITKRFEDSLERLWKSNPTSAFPSPARIRKTMDTLDRFNVDSPGRQEVQENIERFNTAVGMKLESRRMFVTRDGRMGMGPQSLEEGDEIWALNGANVPFVLKRLNEETFQLVGEVFIFGAMHGEAVKDIATDEFRKVKIV